MKRIKDQGAKVGERVSRRRGRVRRRKSGKEAESQSRYGGQSVALESVGVRTSPALQSAFHSGPLFNPPTLPSSQLRFEQSFSKANLSRSSLALTASCRFLGLAFYLSCLLGQNSRAIIHLCHPCRSYIIANLLTELVYVTMLLVIRHVILDCSMPTEFILVEKKSCGACIKQVSSVGGRERL